MRLKRYRFVSVASLSSLMVHDCMSARMWEEIYVKTTIEISQ